MVKQKKCKVCWKKFTPRYSTTEMFCSYSCAIEYEKQKPKKKKQLSIRKVSVKRSKYTAKYKQLRQEYLSKAENRFCFIDGCNRRANTIEHRRGRVGYADDWARENDIPLLIDVRFWAPCCLEHNLELERNPELSRKYQLSKITGKKKI